MVNRTLFLSAAACTLAHIAGIAMMPGTPAYTALLLTACATSLWNHGATSGLARSADRIVMFVGAPVTAIIHPYLSTWVTLGAVASSYGIAKITGRNAPHVVAHLLITALNLRILGLY